MTDAFTPLESLNLTGRYYRCLIRNGYKSIEQIEKYLAEHDELLSKNIANMSPRGDFEIADAIHYYRTGTHLPRPSGIDAMTIKKDDEIQLVRTYRKLSDQDKTAFLDHIKNLYKKKLQVYPAASIILPYPVQHP